VVVGNLSPCTALGSRRMALTALQTSSRPADGFCRSSASPQPFNRTRWCHCCGTLSGPGDKESHFSLSGLGPAGKKRFAASRQRTLHEEEAGGESNSKPALTLPGRVTVSASMSDCPVTVKVGTAVSRTQSSSSRSNRTTIRSASSSFFAFASSSSFCTSTSCTFLIVGDPSVRN